MQHAPRTTQQAEIEIPCPILRCGRILLRYLIHPASHPGCDRSVSGRPGGPPLEPSHAAYLEFDGAYHPDTLAEVAVSRDWQSWLCRAAQARLKAKVF